MSLASKVFEIMGTARFPPRRGPEWGSGGVFGLKFHRGTLYFTLSFEAQSFFIDLRGDFGSRVTYNFEEVGEPGERSGGDTYNASEAVDNHVFFGGWVHAPPLFMSRPNGRREIDFSNKYSHVHAFDTDDYEPRLLWSDTIRHPRMWAGEVSEIIYDPVGDRLLIARGDGHRNLGVFSLNPWRPGRASVISGEPVLKGSIYLDHACFTLHGPGEWHPFRGHVCIELGGSRATYRWLDPQSMASADGQGVKHARAGSTGVAYTKLYTMVRGGIVAGNPVEGEEPVFYRLFDFHPSHYGPLRVNSTYLSGSIITSWNAMTHATIAGTEEASGEIMRESRTTAAPSVLLQVSEPSPRILTALGVRVTSLEGVGDGLILGWSTAPNLERYDAIRVDAGVRGVDYISTGSLLASSPPHLVFRVPASTLGQDKHWGGIPLSGYKSPRLIIWAKSSSRLRIYTYLLGAPPEDTEVDEYALNPGRNVIDLGSFGWGIVSFALTSGRARRAVVQLM